MSQRYTDKLRNKSILVIGGTSGMGFAVAEGSVELNARVVIASSTQQKIDRAVKAIQKSHPDAGERISGHRLDLSADDAEAQVKELLDFATNGGKSRLDHIVECAGDTLQVIPFGDLTPQSLNSLGQVRINAPLLIAKLAKKYMVDSHTSSITLTGGIGSAKPSDGRGVLSAIAATKEGLTRGMAKDLRPIRVNLVSPGPIHTELLVQVASNLGISVDQFIASLREETLTKTVGQPEDIAESYLMFMKNNFVTGTITYVEGGYLLT